MSYDIPYHVREGVRIMFKVADAEIMAMHKKESQTRDKESSPAWGYVATELNPHLLAAKGNMEAGLAAHDVLPEVQKVHEKIAAFEADEGDPVKQIFARAAKAMIQFIDPGQYPEAQAAIDGAMQGAAAAR